MGSVRNAPASQAVAGRMEEATMDTQLELHFTQPDFDNYPCGEKWARAWAEQSGMSVEEYLVVYYAEVAYEKDLIRKGIIKRDNEIDWAEDFAHIAQQTGMPTEDFMIVWRAFLKTYLPLKVNRAQHSP